MLSSASFQGSLVRGRRIPIPYAGASGLGALKIVWGGGGQIADRILHHDPPHTRNAHLRFMFEQG